MNVNLGVCVAHGFVFYKLFFSCRKDTKNYCKIFMLNILTINCKKIASYWWWSFNYFYRMASIIPAHLRRAKNVWGIAYFYRAMHAWRRAALSINILRSQNVVIEIARWLWVCYSLRQRWRCPLSSDLIELCTFDGVRSWFSAIDRPSGLRAIIIPSPFNREFFVIFVPS